MYSDHFAPTYLGGSNKLREYIFFIFVLEWMSSNHIFVLLIIDLNEGGLLDLSFSSEFDKEWMEIEKIEF